jgi:hypothetical protein
MNEIFNNNDEKLQSINISTCISMCEKRIYCNNRLKEKMGDGKININGFVQYWDSKLIYLISKLDEENERHV